MIQKQFYASFCNLLLWVVIHIIFHVRLISLYLAVTKILLKVEKDGYKVEEPAWKDRENSDHILKILDECAEHNLDNAKSCYNLLT